MANGYLNPFYPILCQLFRLTIWEHSSIVSAYTPKFLTPTPLHSIGKICILVQIPPSALM